MKFPHCEDNSMSNIYVRIFSTGPCAKRMNPAAASPSTTSAASSSSSSWVSLRHWWHWLSSIGISSTKGQCQGLARDLIHTLSNCKSSKPYWVTISIIRALRTWLGLEPNLANRPMGDPMVIRLTINKNQLIFCKQSADFKIQQTKSKFGHCIELSECET